jgi:hypothetical protein
VERAINRLNQGDVTAFDDDGKANRTASAWITTKEWVLRGMLRDELSQFR